MPCVSSSLKGKIAKHLALGLRVFYTGWFWNSLPTDLTRKAEQLSKRWNVSPLASLHCLCYNEGKRVACAMCGKPTKFLSFAEGFSRHCGSRCVGADPATKKKRSTTCKERYGVTHVQKLARVRKKFKRTMLRKYGVEHTASSSTLRKQMSDTLKRNHGVTGPLLIPSALAKSRATHLRRYGVTHISKSRSMLDKSAGGWRSPRKRMQICGKSFTVQGYEAAAVRFLVKELGVPVTKICNTAAEGVPTIPYTHLGKKHVYHPDFLIDGKIIVEVKSPYTAGLSLATHRTFWYRAKHKLAAAAKKYRVWLIVVSPKGNAVRIVNPHLKPIKQVRQLACSV